MYYFGVETLFLALFRFFMILVLLLFVALVLLKGLSFAIVVISLANSKILHAAIMCLSFAATSSKDFATDQDYSLVFIFPFVICLNCSTLYCVPYVVQWVASLEAFPINLSSFFRNGRSSYVIFPLFA